MAHDPYAPKHHQNGAARLPVVADDIETDADFVHQAAAYADKAAREIEKNRQLIQDACREVTDKPSHVDPVVAGLLDHLPKSGAVWPLAERKQWLALMEGSFNLIFKDASKEQAA